MNTKRTMRWLIGFFGIAISIVHVHAGEGTLSLIGADAFFEVYVDEPEPAVPRGSTVNPRIVGIRLDNPSKPFHIENLVIVTESQPGKTDALCTNFVSRDGKYFARGRYRWPVGGASLPSIEFPSKYLKKLAEYETRDIAVAAFGGASCDDRRTGDFFAVAYERADAASKTLVVQLQAGDARVRAQLWLDMKNAIGPAILCDKISDGPTVAFSTECKIPLPSVVHSGQYLLSIGETGSSGEIVVKSYPLVLSEFAALRKR